ncbi:pyruvate carboxylase [Marinicaulis aureus]|uniref:Pyruvate carboxylase n=1 Tax=Hyphococcus aureus TaxID=2666033 RepID=A0ABW1KZX9_9PROT
MGIALKFKKILVANRSEIAIRVMRGAAELGIRTVAIYAEEDKLALHRFKADESYQVGAGLGPVKAYLDIEDIVRIARKCGADAIHPGYGFLSENPDFADRCAEEGIVFIGPSPSIMRSLGDKVSARTIAKKAGVPVVPATGVLSEDETEIKKAAAGVGYPLMLKASWGGGGRGMRIIEDESELLAAVDTGRREALSAFGKGDVYLEKLVRQARHVEVQLIGDSHGNLLHLFERDCSVQRRHQKVVERAPAPYLNDAQRQSLCALALKLGREVGYNNAGTVEFLMDAETSAFYFIEVNPRIQVEHTVTEEVTGVDIVKAQIRIAEGQAIGSPESGIPAQENIHLNGHALQCRVTTENPEENFIPDYGRIVAYRGATGFGIRLDGGTAYAGAQVTRFYDSLLEKVTAWAPTPDEAINRMSRALNEFRIRGVATNLVFLANLVNHPKFRSNDYTTRFIDETPELFEFPKRKDRATKLLRFLADVNVNGNPEVKGRAEPARHVDPQLPDVAGSPVPAGLRDKLKELGPEAFGQWVRDQKQVFVTDTTMRDAHQSLLATRMRTYDMVQAAPHYARRLPNLFSLECWGGATFDVAMRFLKEDPWRRLELLRDAAPNIPLQMLLRASNAVGYTNYPDNVVQYFVERAADTGVDIFRVFDSLNWAENMYVAMDAVQKTGAVCEAAICYSGDLTSEHEKKFTLDYYLKLAKDLEAHGAHMLAIKDMAGVAKPRAAKLLVAALKEETKLPVHFHTHDTSGASSASVLAAVDAGVDVVDAALDSMSGLTAQPPLGSIVAALQGDVRDPGLDDGAIRDLSFYWEAVRDLYAAFESDVRSGASEVYLHAMPGGQFTNLREQARSLGIEGERWHEVAQAYADVNEMFGNIVKVTPSSKVVGDMALSMVSAGLTRADVENPKKDISFPESVVSFFHGDLGQPHGGFPKALQQKILKGATPIIDRPGKHMAPVDLEAKRAETAEAIGVAVSDNDLASALLYPKVFSAFAKFRDDYGDMSVLPTDEFFYGLPPEKEISVEIEHGKTLIIQCQSVSDADEEGLARVFFSLNGQPRTIKIRDAAREDKSVHREKAKAGDAKNVGAPMPGAVSEIRVAPGDKVKAGDALVILEAMKMEVKVAAEADGVVKRIAVAAGDQVDAKDLLVELE